ncbi:hypothetical protein Fot_21442 [Forsythia ovata]|uniref:Uncharacterized protein n=1 Tax=Forsythia ovata TaxID=205694 RepID=A0ABD1UUV0_9LAMI
MQKEASTRSSEVERLKGKTSYRQSEISSLQADLEASAKERSNAEGAYVNLLAEKNMHEDKLAGAEAEFNANFHNTEAYASFSAFFASIRKEEVITALRNDFPTLDIDSLEAKFSPVELDDDVDASGLPVE